MGRARIRRGVHAVGVRVCLTMVVTAGRGDDDDGPCPRSPTSTAAAYTALGDGR
jgi:hypothetical protein